MSIDLETLKAQLQSSIDGLTDATAEEILELSLSASNVTVDKIVSVDTTNDLPDLETSSVPSGQIFYIDDIQVLVISSSKKWIGLDNRLLRDDNTYYDLYGWGDNAYGNLGTNDTTNHSSPVSAVGSLRWIDISVGEARTSYGITGDGIAYAWGYALYGVLGDNTTVSKSSPVTVVGDITNWSQISAGHQYCLALTSDGVGYGWGYGLNGRTGLNTTATYSSPRTIVGGLTWTQLSAGYDHALGIDSDGNAYGWGDNPYGQLGTNNRTDYSSPRLVVGGLTWSQVSAGREHCLGITSSGVGYTWGFNLNYQLGTGNNTSYSSPVTIIGDITWSQVSAGDSFSLGISTNGILYSWGSNSSGQGGTGNTTRYSSPVTVVGGITNWSQVSAGSSYSLGVTTDGVAYGWGSGSSGQLGNGNIFTNYSSPVTVIGGLAWGKVEASVQTFNQHSLGLSPQE